MARLVCKPNRSDNCQLIIPVDEVLVAFAIDSYMGWRGVHCDYVITIISPLTCTEGGQGATERNF